MGSEWTQLEEGDDWGTLYAALQALDPKLKTASRHRALQINDGEKCLVRFPDGTKQLVKIKFRKGTSHISDHGIESEVPYKFPGFYTKLHGLDIWLDITEVEVKQTWAEARDKV